MRRSAGVLCTVLACAACGRIGFVTPGEADGAGGDGDGDGNGGGDADPGVNLDTIEQQHYVKASNPGQDDSFGDRVVLSADGNTMAVAAMHEESSAVGIDGNQADNSVPNAGAVYVFVRSGTGWQQQAYVKASNTGANDIFGSALALSADGSILAVGAFIEASASNVINSGEADDSAPAAGAVYVFARTGTTWAQEAYLKASNAETTDHFGYSVSLSADGNTLAVGAPGEDSAATGVGGSQTSNAIQDAGAVYLFERVAAIWTQAAYVKASNTGLQDRFGQDVVLDESGTRMAVAAPLERSAATGVDGNQASNTAGAAGAVYAFVKVGGTWSQTAYLKASNTEASDQFGYALAMSADGTRLVIGSPYDDSAATTIGGDGADNSAMNAGSVFVFDAVGNSFQQTAYLKASNAEATDDFGETVSVSSDGNVLVVGAQREDSIATGVNGDQLDNSAPEAGAVYAFAWSGGAWTQRAYLKASNTDARLSSNNDAFGFSVAISGTGTTIAVGANAEDSSSSDLDGSQTDDGAPNAGALYLFE